MSNIIDKIQISGQSYNVKDSSAATVVELTQQEYDNLPSSAKTGNTLFVITDATAGDLTNYYTKTETDTLLDAKQATLQSGTNIKTINNESILGSGNIDIQGGGVNVVQTTGTSTTDVMSQNAVTTQLSGYVTTDTEQEITGEKTFVGEKKLKFKQSGNSSKIGFTLYNSASTNNELASFEFRPNTFTIDNVQHPLLYFGHYRNTNTANAGVPQTVIGFRQYDQKNAAAYHYLLPLPEKAKTPFSLTTSFKDYYAPIGFKVDSGGTMVTTDNTGVVDLSSYLGGGGSITIDPTLDSGSTNAVANSAITQAVSSKINQNDSLFTIRTNVIETVVISSGTKLRIIFAFDIIQNNQIVLSTDTVNDKSSLLSALATLGFDNKIYNIRGINYSDETSSTSYFGEFLGHKCYAALISYVPDFGSITIGLKRNNVYYTLDSVGSGKYNYNYLSNKPTITTSVTSASTDAQVPSAKAVNDKLGGLSLVKLTQTEYDALATKDSNVLYVIVG